MSAGLAPAGMAASFAALARMSEATSGDGAPAYRCAHAGYDIEGVRIYLRPHPEERRESDASRRMDSRPMARDAAQERGTSPMRFVSLPGGG
jgi:hypothetical protein